MHLWNTKALATTLRNDDLSQGERFKYFLLFVALTAIFMEVPQYYGEPASATSVFESLALVAITVIGTILCYFKNRQGDNKQFIDRYVCLIIPITIKCVTLGLAIYLIYFTLGYTIVGDSFAAYTESTTLFDILIVLATDTAVYWRITYHLGYISEREGGSP